MEQWKREKVLLWQVEESMFSTADWFSLGLHLEMLTPKDTLGWVANRASLVRVLCKVLPTVPQTWDVSAWGQS